MTGVVEVRDLSVTYRRGSLLRPRSVEALSDVSFSVDPGACLAVVGESGSGKSTLCRALMGLIPEVTGQIEIDGVPVRGPSNRERRDLSRHVHLVFQDSQGALNPRFRVKQILAEPLEVHGLSPTEPELAELLAEVQLPRGYLWRRPGELSGGERQRVAIARGLGLRPKLLLLDEPVSALDVSTQGELMDLLARLQRELGLTYVLVSHDLAVVQRLAHHIMVLYNGTVAEYGPVDTVLRFPRHPYTAALIDAVPRLDRPIEDEEVESGDVAPVLDPSVGGCPYRSRCLYAVDVCHAERPPLRPVDDGAVHRAACHRSDEAPELWGKVG